MNTRVPFVLVAASLILSCSGGGTSVPPVDSIAEATAVPDAAAEVWKDLAIPADAVNATENAKAYFFAIHNDEFAPDDEVPELATDFTNHVCPDFEVFSGVNTAGTINAIETSFDGGVQVISTHGDTFFAGAPAGQTWSWKGPGAQVAILTREAVNAGSLQDQATACLAANWCWASTASISRIFLPS